MLDNCDFDICVRSENRKKINPLNILLILFIAQLTVETKIKHAIILLDLHFIFKIKIKKNIQ